MVLLVDGTAEDDDAKPAEASGVQRMRAPQVQLTLSSPVPPPIESARMVTDDHSAGLLEERTRPVLGETNAEEPLAQPVDFSGIDGSRSSLSSACRLLARVFGAAVVLLAVLTVAPFGRPDNASIVAGGGSQPAGGGAGSTTTQPRSTTTTLPADTGSGSAGPAAPLEIDIIGIALDVDPESLGFDLEPGEWVEPQVEPESQWNDGGNGVAMPDLMLRVRFCESSNNYRAAHVASSARGAYQFLSKSWEYYGHAERYGVAEAHQATPAQQDEAALLTYRQVGARPWAESRHCWDNPDIDSRYLTARPPPPPPTTAPASTETTAAPATTAPPSETTAPTTAASTTTSEPIVTAASQPISTSS